MTFNQSVGKLKFTGVQILVKTGHLNGHTGFKRQRSSVNVEKIILVEDSVNRAPWYFVSLIAWSTDASAVRAQGHTRRGSSEYGQVTRQERFVEPRKPAFGQISRTWQ